MTLKYDLVKGAFSSLLLLCIMSMGQVGHSQISFENKTRLYKKDFPTRSVIPGGMFDLDGDMVDDIVVLDEGIWLKPFISSGKKFSLTLADSLRVAQNSEITLAAGDLNNDGLPEIISTGEYSLINVSNYKNNKLTKKAFQSGIYAQGSNTIDVNNDGWLDYFLANDDGPSRIYMNDKKGNLVLTPVIDFMKGDTTDGSGNYGTIWTDVNGDFLPDLYVSKCRAYISDPSDPRRINRLYINRGYGVFEEKGFDFGLNNGEQSWVSTFGDFDNDGDQDVFLVNHYAPHILYENVANQKFFPITKNSPITSFSFQAISSDLDNDGFLDIILAGVEGVIILHNQGNLVFKAIQGVVGPNLPRSVTVGDTNDDGFPDIYAHINEPLNVPGLKDDELWINKGNTNHYIKILLEGSASNKSAVGAHITLFTPKNIQTRYIKGGESFGVTTSFQQIFGLGSSDQVDSLVVRWPSGKKEIFKQLKANSNYFIQEEKCITEHLALYENEVVWKGNQVSLNAPPGFASYGWNNGITTGTSNINSPGKYFVKMRDSNGCTTISKPIQVISGCFAPNIKLINEEAQVKICQGTSIEIASVKASTYLWSDGNTDQSIHIDKSQKVVLTATDFCGKVRSDSVDVVSVGFDWVLTGDSIKKGNPAQLNSNLTSTQWFVAEDLINPIFIGNTFTTPSLDTSTTFYARAFQVIDFKTGFLGAPSPPSVDAYGANSIAGALVFDVEKPCIIKSVLVSTDLKGKRKIIITDNEGDTIFSKEFLLDVGTQRIQLDAAIPPGKQYKMQTDENFNIQQFGFKSPRLTRTFNNTHYPYFIDDVLILNASNFGAIYYYYFYNWEVQYHHVQCQSDFKEVLAFVEKSSHVEHSLSKKNFRVNPSIAYDKINLIIEGPNFHKLQITDTHGKQIIELQTRPTEIDISQWPPGLYFISLISDNQMITEKFIKQ